jgi:anti-sigma B factor antagonist
MIKVEKSDDVLIAKFAEEDRFNALIAEPVKELLMGYFSKPGVKLILNLEGIKFIDSSGFGVFLSLMKTANNTNGALKICNLRSDVKELFQVLQLHNVFDIYDTVEECKISFS